MKKNIFNLLLVCLLVFITVYFALKISEYGMQLEKADNEFNNSGSVSSICISVDN